MAKVLEPPDWQELWTRIRGDAPERLIQVLATGSPVDSKGRYLHWTEMSRRTPPDGLTLEEWWIGTKASRRGLARQLPLTGADGRPFQFSNVEPVQEMVHHIDQQAAGRMEAADLGNLKQRDRYLVSSLVVEEAITSSLLEGAATTRRVAREMLQSRRRPRDDGERMVLNNYNAMTAAEKKAREGDPLAPDDVLDLHRVVTEGTLEDEADAGRLQTPDEVRVFVADPNTNKVLHHPPPAEQLPERLERLCVFANGELDGGFLHPVVRAILIHLWVGYDHPFVDGNGRTARALFYWSMLRSGYWLAQYFSVSTILRKATGQYIASYMKAETDDNDATYFVIYQLEVIKRAIASLNDYISKKTLEVAEVEQVALQVPGLNRRQIAVINAAQRDPYRSFTISEHQLQEQVTYQSARSDLLRLEELGLLHRTRVGKRFEFRSSGDLPARLRSLAEQA